MATNDIPNEIPSAGGASPELAAQVHETWRRAAATAGIDLSDFNPESTLETRLAWAKRQQLSIALVLSRFSSRMQHSTGDQVHDTVSYAALHGMYVPPEYVCVDEAVSGRKVRRDGLNRAKYILLHRLAVILLVYKISRMFRTAYRGFAFVQEEVVDEGLRAIGVSQNIDTIDEKTWKQLAYLHGIMDELFLTSVADHVYSGLAGLFRQGYIVGALTLGYCRVEVPGARPTNTGKPRTMPAPLESVADLIRQHYEWIRDGMPIAEGLRRWRAAGGPCDPRSTLGYMTYHAYRRMLSNPRYTGLWAFGTKKNCWSSKKDYNVQVPRPDDEVTVIQSEELRIVDSELYLAVQQRLEKNKHGRCGHKKRGSVQLCDLLTHVFRCAQCKTRFYQAGGRGKKMQCKRYDLCPCLTTVRRDQALKAVCSKLGELIVADAELIEQVIAAAQALGAAGDDVLQDQLKNVEQRLVKLNRRREDLMELAGEGSDADRDQFKNDVRAVILERSQLELERTRLQRELEGSVSAITPDQVRQLLANFSRLLEDGAAGKLGPDLVYRAGALFEMLVGGRIDVHVEPRPARKQVNVRGTFMPALLETVRSELRVARKLSTDAPQEVSVWLRKPPRLDELAERVHELMDIEKHTYRSAAKVLQAEGRRINSGVVWQIFHRYYEMIGQPVPDRPYNNGHQRRPRGPQGPTD